MKRNVCNLRERFHVACNLSVHSFPLICLGNVFPIHFSHYLALYTKESKRISPDSHHPRTLFNAYYYCRWTTGIWPQCVDHLWQKEDGSSSSILDRHTTRVSPIEHLLLSGSVFIICKVRRTEGFSTLFPIIVFEFALINIPRQSFNRSLGYSDGLYPANAVWWRSRMWR